MKHVILRYKFSTDDDFGWLDVEVNSTFSGRGGFWVQWQDVQEFGQSLRAYPLPADALRRGAWGYEPWEGDSLIVRIEVVPANATGDLRVEVEVADHFEQSNRVRTSFLTNYPQLEAFSDAVVRMMRRETTEAILVGS